MKEIGKYGGLHEETKPALSGLSPIQLVTAGRYCSSGKNDAKRPCDILLEN